MDPGLANSTGEPCDNLGDADGVSTRQWKIFISHSTKKDDGQPTPITGTILDTLRAELKDGFELLIDDNMPKASAWNPLLHRWMMRCNAAVILLDNKACNSDWMKREFSIFMLRHALCPGFVVLPVIINLERGEIEDSFFEDLLTMQDVSLRTAAYDEVTPDECDRVVADITEFAKRNFSGPPFGLSDAMYKWFIQVALLLPEDPDLLRIAAESFGCDQDGIGHVALGDGTRFLADQFLSVTGADSERWRITSAVQEMRRLMSSQQRSSLGDLLSPVWVGAERARPLLPRQGRDEKRRLVLLPAAEPKTAEDYISRAYCCSNSLQRHVVQTGAPTGEHEEEVASDIENAVKVLLRNEKTGSYSPGPRAELPYYLIIPLKYAAKREEFTSWVHDRYADITVLVLTGANEVPTSKRIEDISLGVTIHLDGLDAETEGEARRWVNYLRDHALG